MPKRATPPATPDAGTAAPKPTARETATIDLGGARIKKPLSKLDAPQETVSEPPTPSPAQNIVEPAEPVVPAEPAEQAPPAAPVLPNAPAAAPGMPSPPEKAPHGVEAGPDGVTTEEERPGLATATLAELYVSQGHLDRAVNVYRQLVASNPNNAELQSRLDELELLATASKEAERPRAVSPRSSGLSPGLSAASPADPNIRFLENAIRELEGWLAAIGRP